MTLTPDQVAHEKAAKPRPDLVPSRAIMAAGRAMAAGVSKHGGGLTGRGTYRDPGEQSDIANHVASFERHWRAWLIDPRSVDAGTGLSELDCAVAQLCMIADLHESPVR